MNVRSLLHALKWTVLGKHVLPSRMTASNRRGVNPDTLNYSQGHPRHSHCSVHWTPCVIQRELSTLSLFLFCFCCWFWYLATFIYTIWWQWWCWTEANWTKLFVEGGLFSVNKIVYLYLDCIFVYLFIWCLFALCTNPVISFFLFFFFFFFFFLKSTNGTVINLHQC